jgi:hypothetical protein
MRRLRWTSVSVIGQTLCDPRPQTQVQGPDDGTSNLTCDRFGITTIHKASVASFAPRVPAPAEAPAVRRDTAGHGNSRADGLPRLPACNLDWLQ